MHHRALTPFLLILLLASTQSAQGGRRDPRPLVGSSEKLLVHFERWRSGADGDAAAPFHVSLGWSRGRSERFTRARGAALIDLERARITVTVEGVTEEDLAGAAAFDVWLGLDDRIAGGTSAPYRLGSLRIEGDAGILEVPIHPALAGRELEEVWLARPGAGMLLVGSPDLFQRMAALERTGARELRSRAIGGIPLSRWRTETARWSADGLDELVARGERLFFEETFGGNGRTCGTCHRAENDFTLDPAFIATLPDDDPLFVAERVPELDSTRNGGRVFESPRHMRRYGLIVVNTDGFGDTTSDFVLRSVQGLRGLAATIEPAARLFQPFRHLTGWAGDGSAARGSLREFALGAVRQHFTRTLDRREGVDVRLPDAGELTALEAFQLTLGRTEDPDLSTMAFTDPGVRRGLETFLIRGLCNACHGNAGGTTDVAGTIGGAFVGTGVETLTRRVLAEAGLPAPADGGFGTRTDGGFGTLEPRPDGGYGNGRFNAPSLVELADTLPAFHGHVTADPASGLADTVEGAIAFYNTREFVDSEVGGGTLELDLTPREIDDLGRLLRVLNALDNARTVDEYVERALAEADGRPRFEAERRVRRLLQLALLENGDAMRVLAEVGLHPDAQEELREVEAELRRAQTAPGRERSQALETARARLAAARSAITG
jgi:cytochrome c peroxidase